MAAKYLFLMVAINIPIKKLSAGPGIGLPVLIIWVFHVAKRENPCCINLEDCTPALIMVGSEYTII